jgi:hypothetical protein
LAALAIPDSPVSYLFLPRVGDVSGVLFRFDVFGFEIPIRPPVHAGFEQMHGLGKKLIPVGA